MIEEEIITGALVVALFATGGLTVFLIGATVWTHAAASRNEKRRDRRWNAWKPVLLDALVGSRDPSSVALLVGRNAHGDYFRLLIAYALRLGGRSHDVLAEAAAPHLDTAKEMLHHRRSDRRALATHLFGLLGSRIDLKPLRLRLKDESPAVAMIAARGLARSQDPDFVRPVLDTLDRFEAWGVNAVASMLALFGFDAAPHLMLGVADPARPESTRCACVESLRLLGYPPASDLAVSILEDGETPLEVQAALLRLLRDIGGPGHAPTVRELTEHPSDVIRIHAVSALAAISLQPADAARVENALSDTSPWVALRAAQGLIDSGRVASLRTVASEDSVRAAVARQALAEAGLAEVAA
ncbi:HEAT repeat domain-containing protein [Rubrivirga sp.]|uniref:HEAT repeat domain-containing protein n=1 Tax=Rubrivirga sp. TaxID=1885344 RepID=UPI003C78ABB7